MISVTIPLGKPLPNPTNLREHWGAKAKRVKQQRSAVQLVLAKYKRTLAGWAQTSDAFTHIDDSAAGCMRVRFVRISPRKLDDDGNVAAFKAHRDAVADLAGVDDGSPVWRWEYAQETGKPAIRIEVEVA